MATEAFADTGECVQPCARQWCVFVTVYHLRQEMGSVSYLNKEANQVTPRHSPWVRCNSALSDVQEGCLVGVLAVGHTQQARKRQASEAAWTCWRQPGCSADAVSPEQSGTQKRESSRIPPQKRQRRAVTCLAANTAADHLPQIICICPPCRFPEHLRSREEPR
ncbi:transmembrane protein 229B isoform X3 [Anser cygnoides]|uniref:transmembrane protein 229B isoform X3 n=1 Tax=Anser cygnoides TaxID=8845 RepID=UPI0034D375BA